MTPAPAPDADALTRLRAGETVPFDALTDADLRALIPDFADRWRTAMADVARDGESEAA